MARLFRASGANAYAGFGKAMNCVIAEIEYKGYELQVWEDVDNVRSYRAEAYAEGVGRVQKTGWCKNIPNAIYSIQCYLDIRIANQERSA